MKHANGILLAALGITAAAAAVTGCGVEVDSAPVPAGDIGESVEASTGSTPVNPPDVEYLFEIPNPPSGVNYTGLAVSGSWLYVARSDSRVERRSKTNGSLSFTSVSIGQSIDWINGSDWDLISAMDGANGGIYRKATTGQQTRMGSYPAACSNIVQGLTAAPVTGAPTQKLKIYVICGSWPNIVMRTGQYDRFVQPPVGIVWENGSYSAGPYSWGLNHAYDGSTNRVFRMLNYTESHFHWFSPSSPYTTGYELGMNGTPNYTDHTYNHNEGELDRFAPVGFDMDPNNGYFYGLDDFYNNETGRHAWVVARMHRSSLKF